MRKKGAGPRHGESWGGGRKFVYTVGEKKKKLKAVGRVLCFKRGQERKAYGWSRIYGWGKIGIGKRDGKGKKDQGTKSHIQKTSQGKNEWGGKRNRLGGGEEDKLCSIKERKI